MRHRLWPPKRKPYPVICCYFIPNGNPQTMLEAVLSWLNNLDAALLLTVNGDLGPQADALMRWVSNKWSWLPLYGLLVAALVLRGPRPVWLTVVVVVLLIALADQLSSGLLKPLTERLRPCNPEALGLGHGLHIPYGCGGGYGFVSSHAANTMGVAVLVGLLLRPWQRWLLPVLVLWSLVNGYSRIYLGVHYPGDVFFGWLLGAGVGYSLWRLQGWVAGRLPARWQAW